MVHKEPAINAKADKEQASTSQSATADANLAIGVVSQISKDDEEDDSGADMQNMVFTIPVDHQGTAVYIKGWTVANSDKPPIVIVHDLGENIGLYRTAAKALGDQGYSVFGFDLRGHGRSGRFLGHIPHFDTLVNDLLQVVAWIRYKSNRRVPIIISQGMGALISINFQQTYPDLMQAGILIAPVLDNRMRMPLLQRVLVRTLAEILPRVRLPRTLVPRFITRFPTESTISSEIYRGITANFAKELMNALNEAAEAFHKYTAKSLIIAPSDAAIFDFSFIEGLLCDHPNADQLKVVCLEKINIQPLSSGEAELAIVMQEILPWLEALSVQAADSEVAAEP